MTQECVDIVAAIIGNKMKQRVSVGKDYYTDGRIDQLINTCWKLGMEIPEPTRRALPELGAYYTWISDMEGFDYSGFNPEWLHHSFTMYYKRRFRKSTALRGYLAEVISGDADEDYLKVFFTIYGKED